MLRDLGRLPFGVLLLVLSAPSGGRAESLQQPKQEQKRRELHDRLGIKDRPKTEARPDGPDAGVAEEKKAATLPGEGAAPGKSPAAPARPLTYLEEARPVLEQHCAGCHAPGGKAGRSGWVFRGDVRADHSSTLPFVNLAAPTQSALLRKARGESIHFGGKVLSPGSSGYTVILRWIEGGARFGRDTPPPRGAQPSPAPVVTSSEAPIAKVRTEQATTVKGSSPPTLFAPQIHELLLAGCSGCHAVGKVAGGSRYLASPDARSHFENARALVRPGSAETSVLVQRARGEAHPPGSVWAPGSPELALLASWIEGGAPFGTAAAPLPNAAAVPPAPSPVATASETSAGMPSHGGISIGPHPFIGTLRLNGRFDLNAERVNYSGNPFGPGAKNALRSYHHFLFLTRQSADDPLTITLEFLTLQFWEVGYRISRDGWPVQLSAKFGKLLVPFGADPLFHHSYGGHAGFDQKVLPAVFAREGVAVNLQRRWRGVALSGDVYLIAGYGLKRADGLLSLQADFAPLEETRLGMGVRLGASWGPVSMWYSPYFNTLGFGRRLFLQALDVVVWRPRGIKVLEYFSFGAGILRGDVSGGAQQGYGGPGADYYHFASYFQLRYYPRDWLYVQYRQGLRTFGNRRGVFIDETNLTRDDGSTHNLGVVARWRGLSVGIYQFWNFEKADEVRDDLTRLVVSYEF